MAKCKWRIGSVLILMALAGAVFGQPAVQVQNAITEVRVEHTPCYGACPVYTLILRRDGTATFIGVRNVEKIGTYTTNFSDFSQLTQAIEQRGFSRFKPRYAIPATDLPHTITTVIQSKGQKTVDRYGNTGPQSLWEIEAMIDGAVAEAHWKKVSSQAIH